MMNSNQPSFVGIQNIGIQKNEPQMNGIIQPTMKPLNVESTLQSNALIKQEIRDELMSLKGFIASTGPREQEKMTVDSLMESVEKVLGLLNKPGSRRKEIYQAMLEVYYYLYGLHSVRIACMVAELSERTHSNSELEGHNIGVGFISGKIKTFHRLILPSICPDDN